MCHSAFAQSQVCKLINKRSKNSQRTNLLNKNRKCSHLYTDEWIICSDKEIKMLNDQKENILSAQALNLRLFCMYTQASTSQPLLLLASCNLFLSTPHRQTEKKKSLLSEEERLFFLQVLHAHVFLQGCCRVKHFLTPKKQHTSLKQTILGKEQIS